MLEEPKPTWSEADFEVMGWHDVYIHAIAFLEDTEELAFDIDYIFEWVHPGEGGRRFSFWIAPATWVFRDVSNLKLDLQSLHATVKIEDVRRASGRSILADKTEHWEWTIDTRQGDIVCWATGYKMYLRQQPRLVDRQALTQTERGGISFARTAT